MSRHGDPRRNASGAMDRTAYEAIRNVTRDAEAEGRLKKVLSIIYSVCELTGFRIEGEFAIRDKKSGKVWKL